MGCSEILVETYPVVKVCIGRVVATINKMMIIRCLAVHHEISFLFLEYFRYDCNVFRGEVRAGQYFVIVKVDHSGTRREDQIVRWKVSVDNLLK